MICEACKAEGKTSVVYEGVGSTTCGYSPPFYDEQGQHHNHDRNVTTMNLSCSNGHTFTKKSYHSCWCGWKGDPT